MQTIDRRGFLVTAALASLGAAAGGFRAMAAETRLRCVWWGSADRNKRTNDVIALYQKADPQTVISGEMIAGSDYWTKLATSMAGRNVADIFQLEPSTIADYSGRGACMELDQFVGSSLDLSNFGKSEVDLCRIDGKLYGVGLGLNSFCMMYDAETLKEAGVSVPKEQITWKALAELARDFKKNAPARRNYWAVPYGARYHYVFDVWLRQRGKLLFQDGTIGFNKEDAKEWFAYWEDLREKKLCVSADIQTRDDNTIRIQRADSWQFRNRLCLFQPACRLPGAQQEDAVHWHAAGRGGGKTDRALLPAGAYLVHFVHLHHSGSCGEVHQLLCQRSGSGQGSWRRTRRAAGEEGTRSCVAKPQRD